MAIQLQLRRGTTAENDGFIGAAGEVTVDTTTKGLRVHDGITQGGAGLIDTVVDYQLPTAQNNYTWYRKYSSGWVEQGGVVTTNAIVSLPITMSDTNYTITTGNNHYSDSAGTPVVVYYNKQVDSFEIQGRWNGTGVSGLSANWAVFGVAA
jgi:hypothetical protein